MITVDEARRLYEDADSAHGFSHVLRVWHLCERIGREEGADPDVLRAAALLHDVGRAEETASGVCHAAASARRARQILASCDPELVERVAQAVAEHRFRGGCQPTTLEARILFDADKLDAIGAVGVARAYAVAGAHDQPLWAQVPATYVDAGDLSDCEHTPVHEYVFKLSKLRDLMLTESGRRMAEHRHRLMAAFFEELEREVHGRA